MRIQIIVDCYLPSTKSSAKLVHDLAVELQRRGHEVCVAAPDDSIAAPCQVSRELDLTVLRIKTAKIKGASRFRRAIAEARLSATMWKRGREYFRLHPCDLVVFYSPSIFFGALVARLKKLWACPAYLILRDIFPQWVLDTGVLKEGPIAWYFRRKERLQYVAADWIGVQSPANLQYFRDRALDRGRRLEVLYNWTTLDEGEVPLTHFRQRLGLAGKVIFFYGGNIGIAQDMDNILRLAEHLRHEPRLHFLLVGDGSEVGRLRDRINREELTNVTLHPAIDQREYLGILAEIDIGLITLDRQLKTQNLPGKMLGYMYHSRPILASINPGNDLQELLERHAVGLVSVNGDDRRLRANALQLAASSELRERLGKSGRRLLERTFCVSKAAEQIVSHVEASCFAVSRHPKPKEMRGAA